MPKNNLNSWVGTTMQPQFQTYQTAGMLQPAQPPQTPPAPPPGPAPAPQTGTGGSNPFTPPTVGAPAFPSPIPTTPQTQPQTPFQPPTTQGEGRDRLVNALLGLQTMEN